MGANLAQIELRIALRRVPDYRLTPGRTPISHAGQVRGVIQLPIVLTPERSVRTHR